MVNDFPTQLVRPTRAAAAPGLRGRRRGYAVLLVLAAALPAGGCRDVLGTEDLVGSHVQPPAAVVWNAVAETLVARTKPNQQAAFREFAYLSLAQYGAVVGVQQTGGGKPASERAAVAGASAAVLAALMPTQGAFVDSLVRAQEQAGFAEPGASFAAGEAIGRATGARVAALASSDNFNAQWTGTVPTGPGYWYSAANPPAPPLLPLLGQMRTFVMTSGSEFRAPPPPVFGSADFLAALAEIRHFSDTRTPQQDSLAKFWAMATGSLVAGYWNGLASRMIAQRRLTERAATHVLALMDMAAMDANIACHDSKYTYWFIRPSEADPGIHLAIGLPNHPSYPSNHACQSGTAAGILSAVFPDQQAALSAMAEQAAMSRLYAGIHYRFDKDAGLEIARRVVARALAVDQAGGLLGALR